MSDRDLWERILKDPLWMLDLYASGAFPMAPDKESDTVHWFQPDERCIIPLDSFNTPRSVKKLLKENIFTIKYDKDISGIISGCAGRKQTWISGKLIDAYKRIEKLGFLHSVEAYSGGALAGGLYGISIGRAFFGESMFSVKPGASKVALASLLDHLKKRGYVILDVQYMTEHLAMFGAKMISMEEYNGMIKEAIKEDGEMHWF